MPCYHPVPAFEYVHTQTGQVFFSTPLPKKYSPNVRLVREFKRKCYQCVGCRESYARSYAIRCEHESLSHEFNSFITLTVDDEHLEEVFPGGSLRYEPFQAFLKRFRDMVSVPIRFFMCGEYGEQFSRPHYHSIIFGWFPSGVDAQFYKKTEVGNLYTSRILSKVWKFGFHTVAGFSIQCAQYVAGYIQKKINGKMKEFWYKGRTQEFAKMSLKPGLGKEFYGKFTGDLYRRDAVVLRGGDEIPIPRYYDKLHEMYHPNHMAKLKLKRTEPDPVRDWNNTPERLAVRKEVHLARLRTKARSYES